MKIKVESKNEKKIEEELQKVNGRATAHTFSTFSEVARVVADADSRLDQLRLTKAERIGAQVLATSGMRVSHMYQYRRRGTTIQLELCGSGWFLIWIVAVDLGAKAGQSLLRLLPDQRDRAVEKLCATFQVYEPAKQ